MCEMYTPKWVFSDLGTFDLDVCAPKGGVLWIPAMFYYTEEDDGLSSPWFGRVWCNPPFSDAKRWMEKFMKHGNGVALVPVSKSLWFDQLLANQNARIEILPSTLKFVTPNGDLKAIRSPCCLVRL